MRWSSRNMLGIAIEDASITVCEMRGLVADRSPRPRVVRGAKFDLPQELSIDHPTELGQALAKFLSEQGFATRRAAVGLPANWLLVQPNELPPGDDEETLATLRLKAESAFATESGTLVMDCLFDSARGETRQTLLVAARQNRIEAVQAMAEQAHLKLMSVGSSLMALTTVMKPAEQHPNLLLRVAPTNLSILRQDRDQFVMVQHLTTRGPVVEHGMSGATWDQRVAGELRRITAAIPSTNGSIGAARIAIWDDAGLTAERIDGLERELGLSFVRHDRWASLGVQPPSLNDPTPSRSCAVAAAVALAAVRPRSHRVDLLQSRLKPSAPVRGLRNRFAVVVAIAVLVAAGAFATDVTRNSRAISRSKIRIDQLAPKATAAAHLRDKVTFSRGWYHRRPQHIDCLLALTAAFPKMGSAWASNVTVRPDMTATVIARAMDKPSALAIFDALTASSEIEDVKLAYLRQTDRQSQEVSFSITFRFKGRSST